MIVEMAIKPKKLTDNPKKLTVRDILTLIYGETWVQLYSDDQSSVVLEGFASVLFEGETPYDAKEVLDIEASTCAYNHKNAIMINFYEE